jgi:hypothetical protein
MKQEMISSHIIYEKKRKHSKNNKTVFWRWDRVICGFLPSSGGINTLRTGNLNCLNGRSRVLNNLIQLLYGGFIFNFFFIFLFITNSLTNFVN